MLALPRSASTSQIDSTSPTPHFETATGSLYPLSTGSRPHQRVPGAISLSESNPLSAGSSSKQASILKAGVSLEPISSGLKAPPNSSNDHSLTGAGIGHRGLQCGLSLEPPSMSWWYTKKSADLPDFVLISEFSEMEGPRAVMTIPDNIVDLTRDSYSSQKQRAQEPSTKHSQDASDASSSTLAAEGSGFPDSEDQFDIHEFVLRITSVDQQARESSGSFHIPEDIEVHISDTEKGYWAYVHQFTLFDINARGFVRPFCMSYITRDPHKILQHYEEMRHKFTRAALYFKTGNYALFRQDLTKKLRDLNYTNNLLSEAPADPTRHSDTSATTVSGESSLPSESSPKTLAQSVDLSRKAESSQGGDLTEQQKADLESIKDAIETATHIISVLEHYSIDGQPLLGHADDGHEGPQSMAPLSDLSPMTSSENLAMLAAGRSGPTDPSLFLGASLRSGSRIRRKASTPNVTGGAPSRILDAAGGTGMMSEGLSAPLPPHLLGIQQDQSRKNSVVSDYDSMMYEAPEYEAQYVTTLYPIYRDEVVFRPLRELCIANMVWNSSFHFHLGIKRIKDILKEFQADSQLLGEAADSLKRIRPTISTVTIGQRFMINFRNPDFNRITARPTQHHESPVPLMELLQGISLANAPSEDGVPAQEILISGAQEPIATTFGEPGAEERRPGPTMDAEDADDEQTGYDSLDDAASFFTAVTGMATHSETPTRDAFIISPLDRSARVVEWHQEQQTLHRAKGAPNNTSSHGALEQVPWSFGAGMNQGEQSLATGTINRHLHRQSAQSGTSMGIITSGPIQATYCPTTILDTLQKDPTPASDRNMIDPKFLESDVCVLDYDTLTWANGRQYTDGILLESIFRNLSIFSEDASFVAFVDAKVFDILLKSFLYYHLIFHGRLYQGGLMAPGAQAFYSSGASDDGEAFSYQNNFRSSRPSPASPRAAGFSRLARRSTSAYPSSTQLGATLYKTSSTRPASLSSHESSDAEKPLQGQHGNRGHQHYERNGLDRLLLSGDESIQGGGPTQYTTSQGMRKWKKWFEYWSAKSAAMIDPALAAFGRSDSAAVAMEGAPGDDNRRKRTSSRRSSPHRRSKTLPNHHTSPGRHREAREREKERDRERDRERNRKSAFDHFNQGKEKSPVSNSSDSELNINNEDMATFEKELIMNEKSRMEYLASRDDDQEGEVAKPRVNESYANLTEALTPTSKGSGALRRLKPKRPLLLHRSTSKLSEAERERERERERSGQDDQTGAVNGESFKWRAPSGSVGSPPHSTAFHSLAGAIRAMSFGHSSGSTIAQDATPQVDTLSRNASRRSTEIQPSPRNSKEFSDSTHHHKEVKRRGSTRAKAKAWLLKSKRKRRSRVSEGEQVGQAGQEPQEVDEHGEDLSEDDQEYDHEPHEPERALPALPQEAEDAEMTVRAAPRSAPSSIPSASSALTALPVQSRSSVDLTQTVRPYHAPEPALEVPLTIQEIAAQEPTRITPRVLANKLSSSGLSSGNNSSRVSSANPSRITSPTVLSFSAGHRQRLDPKSGARLPSKDTGPPRTTAAVASTSLEERSEIDDSEYDPRRDPGRESATEYETSLETFAGPDSGNLSSFGHEGNGSLRGSNRQSFGSSTRTSLDAAVAAADAARVSTMEEADSMTSQQQQQQKLGEDSKEDSKPLSGKDMTTVTLTEEEEAVVREMLGGITGADDWAIIVHLATMVDVYERSKDPTTPVSNEP
ncbi:hypothetical protein BGZ54_007265 [Gamsiella multidivaricata]|nr:hypothetical protein BGZ54_007265 [Gamsiella multidivaricata]